MLPSISMFPSAAFEAPRAYVVSLNLRRRHLNESQRAMVAAKLATMRQGERTDLEPSANFQKVSQADAAKLLNVSPRSVAAKLANMRQGARTDLARIQARSQAKAADLLNVSPRGANQHSSIELPSQAKAPYDLVVRI
jgi:hypothetical protein